MKACLLGVLVGMAISFASPTYAQQRDATDPQTTQKILAIAKAYAEAKVTTMPLPLPRYSRATRFLLRQRGQEIIRNSQRTPGGEIEKTLGSSPRRIGNPLCVANLRPTKRRGGSTDNSEDPRDL